MVEEDSSTDGFELSGVHVPPDLEIRVREDDGYRTCSKPVELSGGGTAPCGRDCEPEDTGADGIGARLAFVCPEHGLHSVVDPFEHLR